MATSFFFRNTDYSPEQTLMQDLADEMIKIFGIDVYYVIRSTNYVDKLFDEAPTSSFNVAVPIEMYINSFEGFQGEGDLLSKFGLNVADKLTLSVSRRRFAEDIATPYQLIRPQEGDLVYFPFTQGVFEVKFVEHEASFYQTGALQYFELQLEKFNYNSERFNTGVAVIDQIQQRYSVDDNEAFFLITEDGYNYTTEDKFDIMSAEGDVNIDQIDPINQNQEFEDLADTFIDFSITNPFSEDGGY
jgi:Virus neck protein